MGKVKGGISEVFRYTVHFIDSVSESDTYTTVLKVPGFESMRAANETRQVKFPIDDEKFVKEISECHQTEIDFYNHLSKTLDIPVPYVFKTLPWKIGESQGLIHMEDMTGKGKPLGIGEFVTIPQIKKVIRYLAHMHRMSLTSQNAEFNSWKGKHNDNQFVFASISKVLTDPTTLLELCKDKGRLSLLH